MSDLMETIIAHGLGNDDIRKAIIEYIQAKTAAERPKDEWREVYRKAGRDVRFLGEVEVSLYMVVSYHEGQRTVKIQAHMERPDYFDPMRRQRFRSDQYYYVDLWHTERVTIKETYYEAIDQAIALWPDFVELFIANSTPEPEANAEPEYLS